MTTVIVGYDGSDAAGRALAWGVREAELIGWPVRVVQSWRDPALAVSPYAAAWVDLDTARRELDAQLAEVADKVRSEHPGVHLTTEVSASAPVDALLDAAGEGDLLVVGARGRGGFLGLALGSVSGRVARRATGPVVVVRPDPAHPDGTDGPVLVAVDGTDASRAALRWAAAEAERRGSGLTALLAWTFLEPQGPQGRQSFDAAYGAPQAEEALATIVREVLGDEPTVAVEQTAVCDLAPAAILEAAAGAQLVVVGAHGTRGPGVLGLGSVSQQVLQHAAGPVAVIRTSA